MVFDTSSIVTGFLPLHNWEQSLNPSAEKILDMQSATLGLSYNSEHPFLSYENIKAHAPDFSQITIPAYVGGTTYQAGDLVTNDSKTWEAQSTTTGVAPGSDPEVWVETNLFTLWLRKFTEQSIIKAVQSWHNRKLDFKTLETILEDSRLFNTGNSSRNLIENESRVVGFEFRPLQSKTASLHLRKVGLQLTENQTLTLYLWSANSTGAIDSIDLTYTGAGSLQWFELNWKIRTPGAYYVGYYQDDLTGKAVNGAYNYSYLFQGLNFFPIGKFFKAQAFYNTPNSSPSGHFATVGTGEVSPVKALFDIRQQKYIDDTNFGLNFESSVYCDFTNLFLSWKNELAVIIRKQVAVSMLEHFLSNASTRRNRREAILTPSEIRYELDGPSEGYRKQGKRYELDKAIDAFSFDRHQIDKFCLPCKKTTIKYSTV